MTNEIFGTEFDDSGASALNGTVGDDIIYGLEGNDEIYGGSGINIYIGGAGDDSFFGATLANSENHDIADYSDATGPIFVFLANENGTVSGDASVGNDTLFYIDRIVGTAFDDVFNVGDTFDIQGHIEGGAGNDTINGNGYQTVVRYTSAAAGVTVDLEAGTAQSTGPGDAAGIGVDTLNYISEVRGSDFGDTLLGSNSYTYETFRGRGGADTIDGRDGWDQADYSNAASGITVNLGLNGLGNGVASDDGDGASDILLNIEDVRGSDYADDITGDDSDNEIFGRGGSDTIDGAGGDDELIGGGGGDILIGGAGNDGLEGENGDDILVGGTGINFLGGGDGIDTAIFDGNRADYGVYQQFGSPFAEIVLIDTRTGLPEDTIHFTSSIENFSFLDGTLDVASLGAEFNHTPEAASEVFMVRPGDIVTYNILANDFDADGDPLMLVDLYGLDWNGTEIPIDWDEAGNITFVVPNDSPFGSIEFYANVWDGKGGLAESTVTFQYTADPFNNGPWAQPDIYPTPATDNLLFLGFTAESGPEFFKLGNDGTLNQVTSSGLTGGVSQAEPYLFGDALYFMAYDPVSQKEQVWRGIDGEIELVSRLNNTGGGIAVESFVEFNGGLYFYAAQAPGDNPSGFSGGIFRIDETGAVSQITEPPVLHPDFFYQPVILGSNLVFGGFTEATGPQWWSLDTAGNVTQLSPGTAADSGFPVSEAQIVFNDELYWHEYNPINDTNDLLKIDASGNVTVVETFDFESNVTQFAEFGGNLYFHVNDDNPAIEGDHGGIYKLSGSTVTRLTVESAPGAFVGFFFPTEINGTLYYGAYDPENLDEAWYSISGPAGETVTEIAAGPWPKVVGTGEAILLHEDKIYWNAVDEFGNAQVWVFDPLVGEDVIVSDINSANGGVVVDRFYSFDGEVYFGSSSDGAAGIYKISDAGVVTQVVDSNESGQPFGFFFPMPIGPDEPIVEFQYVTLDVLANDIDFDTQIDHGQSLLLVDVEITSVDGPYGVALGTGTASIVDNKLFFNQGSDFSLLADGQTATVTIAYTIRDTGGLEDTSYAQITITGSGVSATPISGTPNGETIPGTPSDDAILADAGDDIIIGNDGNDFIDGGDGIDTAVFPRSFMDGNGYSVFLNNNGTVRVDAEGTTIDDGSVTLTNVELLDFGGTIYNLILGDENDNALGGTAGNDLILGGDGDDTIEGGAGDDLMGGGEGWGDTLSYASSTAGVTVNLSTGTASGSETGNDVFGDFENLVGGSGNDILTGSEESDEITGGGGNDTIDGQGSPWDIVFYSGNRADYMVTAGAPGWIVIQDVRDGSPDGTDTVTNVEYFIFFDNEMYSAADLLGISGELAAITDFGSAGENETKLFDVLANDQAPIGGVLALDSYAITSVTSDNFGLNGIDVAGLFGIVANQIEFNPGALFDQLNGTQSATITLEYTVSDGLGGFATAPLVITVNGENDAPVAGNASASGGEDDYFISVNLPVFDVDHPFDEATIEIFGQTGPGLATPWSGGGIFTIDFQAAEFFDYLAEGEQEIVTLYYRVIDAEEGVSNDAEIIITINGANDTPIAEDDFAVAVSGEATTIDVLANDSDPDTNDTLTIVDAFSPNATIVIEDGVLIYTANAGFSGEDMISYTIDDGSGSFNFADVFVTVSGGNQNPVAVADDVAVGENEQLTIDVLANDSDPDAGDVLTLLGANILVSSDNPDINNIDATSAFATVGNQYVFNPGTLFDALGEGQTATITAEYTVSDGNGGFATAPLTITVNGVNDAPVAQNGIGFGTEDGPVVAQLAVTDVDDPFNSGTVEIVSSTGTGSISVLPVPGGYNLVYGAEGNHDYLGVGESEEVSITYRVTDTFGGISNEATVTLDIHGENDGPIAVADEAEAVAGTPVEIDVLANDTDPDTNDILTVISATAANGMVTIGEGVVLNYTANVGFSGADTIFYQIADGNGGFSDGTVTVNVTSDNAPPTVADVSLTVVENSGNVVQLLATDENVPALTFNLITPLAGGSIAGSVFSFSPGSEFDYLAVGESVEIVLSYTATDMEGLTSDPANITITVVGQNDMPLLEPFLMPVVNENTATAFLTLQGTDLDTSDILTYAIAGGVDASFFTIDSATGALAFVTPPDFEAFADSDGDNVYIVDVSVSDGTDTAMATVYAQVADLAGVNRSGTSGDDTLDGTVEDDTLSGLTGNDTLTGFAGNDLLLGLAGDDVLDGGDGDDTLIGGLGIDTILGGAGNDVIRIGSKEAIGETIDGGEGSDRIEVTGTGLLWLTNFSATASSIETWIGNGAGILGGAENNTFDLAGLAGGETIGVVDGGAGNDIITGTSADDNLRGGSGDDQLSGGVGNDTIAGGSGADMMSGGEGDDTFEIAGTEAAGDTFDGGDGTDTVSVTGGGNATLSHFDAAASSIEVWNGNNAGIFGTVANDRINLSGLTAVAGLAFVDGSSGNDEITGSMFADDLRGGAGDDTLTGGGGDDTLIGNAGADAMQGGDGNDRFVVAGSDALFDTFDGGDGIDTIEVSGAGALYLSTFNAATSSIESWIGNTAGVIGTTGNDTIDFAGLTGTVSDLGPISGGNGADTLIGSMADDNMIGGAQNDMLVGGGGNDTLRGGAGIDTLFGGDGDDTIIVERTFDISDVIDGGDGVADTLQVAGTLNVTLRDFDTTTNGMEIWQGNNAALVGTGAGNTFNLSGLTAVSGLSYVDGASGHDTIVGSAFADDLRGGAGNDQVSGGGGIDIINGGTGNDILEGGAGDDLFVFNASWGRDQITDFEASDQIVFSGVSGLDDFGDLAQSIVSGNVQIAFGTNTITFVGQTTFLTTDDVSFT